MNKSSFWRQRAPATALAVSLALAGCQTPGGGLSNPFSSSSTGASQTAAMPLSAAEQELMADQQRFNDTVISAVMTGALAGAAIGGLGALALGGNKRDAAKGAAGGAVVGGVLAGIDGYVTAKQEQASRQRISVVQAAANDVRQDNQRLQSYLDTSNRVLAEGKNRLTTLKRDVAAKRLSAEEARQATQREERNITSMSETLAQARKTRDQYMQASAKIQDSPQNKRDLDGEIRRMNQQIAQLEANVTAYNQALQVSRA